MRNNTDNIVMMREKEEKREREEEREYEWLRLDLSWGFRHYKVRQRVMAWTLKWPTCLA